MTVKQAPILHLCISRTTQCHEMLPFLSMQYMNEAGCAAVLPGI